jgi:hypothetical protein
MALTRPRLIILLTAAVTVMAVAAATAAQRPTLRILHSGPLALQGAGFHDRESVVVTVHMGNQRWTKRTVSSRAGGFTARFPKLRLRYCSLPLTITARGARGDVARAALPIRDCAPS